MRMSGFRTSLRIAVFTALAIASAAPAFAVDCCSLNGGPCNIIPPLVHGVSPWTGSACGTTISGTNCTAQLGSDVTFSSGDCITLGSGVTFDFAGFEILCTDDACGNGVRNTNSSGASSKVVVKNGFVRGCCSRGLIFDGGTDSSVKDMDVDLARDGGGSCTTVLSAGIFTPRGLTSRVVASGGFVGLYAQPGEDIADSLFTSNYVGIGNLGASSASVQLTNVQLLDNTFSIKNNNPGTYIPDATAVSLQSAGGCHCIDASNNCVTDITDCLDFGTNTNTGNTSFVDRALYP